MQDEKELVHEWDVERNTLEEGSQATLEGFGRGSAGQNIWKVQGM